jgi:hypothetical protein
MTSELVNEQRKAIREFYLKNDLYCDRFNKAEDLKIKEKENDDNEAKKEKSAMVDSIQEFLAQIGRLKDRAKKSNINAIWINDLWPPATLENIQIINGLSARECFFQSINQAKIKAELLDKYFSRYEKYLVFKAENAARDSTKKVLSILFIVALVLIIILCVAIGSANH